MTERQDMKVIVITRDRVGYAKRCVRALMDSAGVTDIHIVDHGSTYEPMLTWLGQVAGPYGASDAYPGAEPNGRIHVHWKPNAHPRDIWTNGTLAAIVRPEERFIVTDCDIVVPTDVDWVTQLGVLLDARHDVVKAGLSLRIQDLPPEIERTEQIHRWESQYRTPDRLRKVAGGNLWYFEASVDTTVAMYPQLRPYAIDPAVRLAHVEAVHLPWYEDPDKLTTEQRYYLAHAEHGHWRQPAGYVDNRNL
jgi:hypothetical protein